MSTIAIGLYASFTVSDETITEAADLARELDTIQSAKHGVGLQLSGHTHGGQIWPWHYLAMAQQGGLLAGHSLHGSRRLYISRGTGYWGPPLRVFAPSEITRITLRRTKNAPRNRETTPP